MLDILFDLKRVFTDRLRALASMPRIYQDAYSEGAFEFLMVLLFSPLIVIAALTFGRSSQESPQEYNARP
jgi:hypothetical protein